MELTAEKVFVNFCSKINKIFTYPFVFSISFPKISQIFNLTRISHIGSYSNLIKKFSICNSTFNNMNIHILLIRDLLKDRSRITEYLFYLRFSKKNVFCLIILLGQIQDQYELQRDYVMMIQSQNYSFLYSRPQISEYFCQIVVDPLCPCLGVGEREQIFMKNISIKYCAYSFILDCFL